MMMRSKLEGQLLLLKQEMISMGMLCENAIFRVSHSLFSKREGLLEEVKELYDLISHKEREIESLCLRLLLQQQPVAQDLRLVSSALKMITDMKRIGEQSLDIAEILSLGQVEEIDESLSFRELAKEVGRMVSKSIDAFVKRDAKVAKSVIEYDDRVDENFGQIKKNLIKALREAESEKDDILDLAMIAKYFEKIGDHAVNIAKWVLFSITGRHEEEE